MLKSLNRCDLYVALYCLFLLQGLLYPPGIINQAISFLLLGWAFLVALRYMLNYKGNPALLNATTVLLMMYILYGVIVMLSGKHYRVTEGFANIEVNAYTYLRDSMNSLLPIYVFYHYTRRGLVDERRIRGYFFLFLITFIGGFYKGYATPLLQTISQGSKAAQGTNNMGYSFLSLFPMLYFFQKKPVLQYFLLAIIMVFLLMSMKRGAILIGVGCFVWLLFSNFSVEKNSLRKTGVLAFIIIMLIGGVSYYLYLDQSNKMFRSRMETISEGKIGTRQHLYTKLTETLVNDPSPTHLMVGRGAQSTVGIAGNFAHNDWLETMIDCGLVGIVIFIAFYAIFFRTAWRSRQYLDSSMTHSFLMLFAICILPTFFSMSIQNMQQSKTLLIGFFLWTAYHQQSLEETEDEDAFSNIK